MTEPVGCPRQPEAGAYLLGALSPVERAGYAEHLAGCEHCLREVGQLAGLPGLLARTPTAAPDPHPAGPPPSVAGSGAEPDPGAGQERVTGLADQERVTGLAADRPDPVAVALDRIHRARRTRRALLAAAFVGVAALGALGSTLVDTTMLDPAARGVTGVMAAADLPVRMVPVGDPPVSAAVSLTPRPWGTEVVMRCRYAGVPQSPVYVLVARSADGATTELARWSGVQDQDLVLASATELVGDRLAELEVRNAAGKVLLRADRSS